MFLARIKYSEKALEPFLSSETINHHYGKHHAGYAATLNLLVANTEFQNLPLEQIIIKSRDTHPKIFNNAAQLFNHDFYWNCLKNSSRRPNQEFLSLVNEQFGDFDKFRDEYVSLGRHLEAVGVGLSKKTGG